MIPLTIFYLGVLLRLNALGLDKIGPSVFSDLIDRRPCGNDEFCFNRTDYNVSHLCQCDTNCPVYGDCCTDSPLFQSQGTQSSNFTCSLVVKESTRTHIYVKGSCPADWQDSKTRQACQEPNKLSDPLTNAIFLTDNSTMITYSNAYCAKCNDADFASLQIWQAELKCLKVNGKKPTGLNVEWNPRQKRWVISENGTKYPCIGVTSVIPPMLGSLRECQSDRTIKTCASDWTNSTVESLCKSYTAYVSYKKRVYQNIYCLQCNRKDPMKSTCGSTSAREGWSEPQSLSVLLDFEFHPNIRRKRACDEVYEVYDPFFKRCRDISMSEAEQVNASKRRTSDRPIKTSSPYESCPKIALKDDEFELSPDNRSVLVKSYGKRYHEGEFTFGGNGTMLICAFEEESLVPSYSRAMGVVTYVGLGTSIVFLALHLCAVALVDDLRNLSGKIIASLCLALLLSYISFIIGGLLDKNDKPSCAIVAVVIYYSFLAAFSWMLVLGFDVWRALIRAMHFQFYRGGQWRRFLGYSSFAWLAPGVLTALAVAVDLAPQDYVEDQFRPGFGSTKCWFSQKSSLAVFFGAPLLLIMILNVGFIASAACMAMGARPGETRPAEAGVRRAFRLYVRLAVMGGLTWLVGFLANVLNYTALWFAFVVLNTLQGLFIFIMFTCTAKVMGALSRNFGWAQSFRYSLSETTKKRTATKSTSLTGTSNDAPPGYRSGPCRESAILEKSAFLKKNGHTRLDLL